MNAITAVETAARQMELYEFLQKRGDKWTSEEQVTDSISSYPAFFTGPYHNSLARRLLTADIKAINHSESYDSIIIHGNRGVKLATKNEARFAIISKYGEALRMLKYAHVLESKAKKDGQYEIGKEHEIKVFIAEETEQILTEMEKRMAERRMLAKSIIESDFFSDMPVESQMLYIRLNMTADDDGFISNPRAIMRMYGFADDSMKILISKNFVIQFKKGDNFVYLIKHWKVHNYIQKDRYKKSAFQELLRDVYYDENKAYSLTPEEGHKPALQPLDTDCIHSVSKVDTQDRLGKDSIGYSKDIDSLGEDCKENPLNDFSKKENEDPRRAMYEAAITRAQNSGNTEREEYWRKEAAKAGYAL